MESNKCAESTWYEILWKVLVVIRILGSIGSVFNKVFHYLIIKKKQKKILREKRSGEQSAF